ncbi:TolB family protein [Aurantivibrio plasticivorans]
MAALLIAGVVGLGGCQKDGETDSDVVQRQGADNPPANVSPSQPAIFVADGEFDGIYQIYTQLGAASSQAVYEPLAACGNVQGVSWTPNGETVIFTTDNDQDGTPELYSVSFDGDGLTKISGMMNGTVGVGQFAVSPDGAMVAFTADQDTDGVIEAYTVRIDGSDLNKLNSPLGAQQQVTWLGWAPDSTTVAFIADQNTQGVFELFTATPGSSGAPTRLNSALVDNGDVVEARWTPDSNRVVYLADQDNNNQYELFSVAPNGGNRVKLNGALVSGGDVSEASWAISPDGSKLVYAADQDVNERFELYSVAINGTGLVKLNAPIAGEQLVKDWIWSPDSLKVAYVSDGIVEGRFELYVTQYDASTRRVLNLPLAQDGIFESIEWGLTSDVVYYVAHQEALGRAELYRATIDGSQIIRLSDQMVNNGSIRNDGVYAKLSPDGAKVAYLADQDVDQLFELYVVNSDGSGASTKVNGVQVQGGDVIDFKWSSDGANLLYVADEITNRKNELFRVSADGLVHDRLNNQLASSGDVYDFNWVN